jgi:hypothetical protein
VGTATGTGTGTVTTSPRSVVSSAVDEQVVVRMVQGWISDGDAHVDSPIPSYTHQHTSRGLALKPELETQLDARAGVDIDD